MFYTNDAFFIQFIMAIKILYENKGKNMIKKCISLSNLTYIKCKIMENSYSKRLLCSKLDI